MIFNVGDLVETSDFWKENRGKKGVVKDIRGDVVIVEMIESLLNPDNSVWLEAGLELRLTSGYWKKLKSRPFVCRNLI